MRHESLSFGLPLQYSTMNPTEQKAMRLLKNLNSVQKYQLFFCLTAILPIFIFTALFLQDTKTKLDQAVNSQVQAGVILVEDALNDDYNQLKLSSRQEIRLFLNHIFRNKSHSNDTKNLEQALKQYRATTHFDIVMLLTPEGNVISANPEITPLKNAFFQDKPLFGVQSFTDLGQHSQLASFYRAPIFSTSHKPLGALLVGNFLEKNPQFDTLSKLNPNYHLRIVEKKPFLNTFEEKINQVAYTSAILPLKSSTQETIGYLVFSIPRKDEQDLLRDNLILIIFSSLVALIFVTFISTWFKNDFVIPMNKLALAFQQVAKGNLKERITTPVKTSSQEAVQTFDSFNAMLDNLEEGKTIRTNLITTLTHDLRTPLLAQERVIDILSDENDLLDTEKRIHLLNGLNSSNHNLLEMVNTLLEVYEYEEGDIILKKNPVHLKSLVAACFSELEPLAEHKKIQLAQSIQPDSMEIQADIKHLKRVFINLIANAIQNVPKESQVQVQATVLDSRIEIKIADDGPGIAPEILPHVFERYFSGHPTQKKIGTGLGLYICKTIVELHHGHIAIDSHPGQGTAFTIKLPTA
jgi:signal transduction histidine kinase